jgi:hypothetical protein
MIAAISTAFASYSQKSDFIEIINTGLIKTKDAHHMDYLFNLENGDILILKTLEGHVRLEYYQEDMTLIRESEDIVFALGEKKKKQWVEHAYMTEDENIVLICKVSFVDMYTDKLVSTIYYANIIDTKEEKLRYDKSRLIKEINYNKKIPAYNEFAYTENNSSFAFISYAYIENSKKDHKIEYLIFNQDLEISSKSYFKNDRFKDTRPDFFLIDNNEKLTTIFPEPKDDGKSYSLDEYIGRYIGFINDTHKNTNFEFDIKVGANQFFDDMTLHIDKKNILRGGAVIYNDAKEKFSKQVLNFSIDLNEPEQPEIILNSYNEELITAYEDAEFKSKYFQDIKNKEFKGIRGLRILEIIPTIDGYYMLMMKYKHRTTMTGVYSTKNHYWVLSFTDDHKPVWMKKVPFKESYQYYSTASEIICLEKDLYFIHFDSYKNYKDFSAVLSGKLDGASNCLVSQKLDEYGELSRGIIMNYKDLNFPSKKIPETQFLNVSDQSVICKIFDYKNLNMIKIDIVE